MIEVGGRLPDGVFRVKDEDGTARDVTTAELFGDKRVVLVGVPGAFTTTCHSAHVPQFVANAAALKARGADRVVVMAVNDHHVMRAWATALGGLGKIDFVADGDGAYARALGLDIAIPGMGLRMRRFSALVDDGVIRTLNFEPQGSRGIVATGAAAMLKQLGEVTRAAAASSA